MADRHVTIVEAREPHDGCGEWPRWPVARLNYAPSESAWRLYWRDGELEFHPYDSLPPTPRVQDLIDHEPYGPGRRPDNVVAGQVERDDGARGGEGCVAQEGMRLP